jgi:predicted alpha-1,2-mannosidase
MSRGSKYQNIRHLIRNFYISFSARPACVTALLLFAALVSHASSDPVSWVNSDIGTGSGPVGYGRTMPFVTPPFGMTSWTPQTRQNRRGGNSYKYQDKAISGFMGTHQPALWMGDYGYVTLMPEIDMIKVTPQARKLSFRHADEIVRPDYYSVWMDAGQSRRIRTEMTATMRCAYMRFTFPASTAAFVAVEASRSGVAGFAHVDVAKREIAGYNPDRMDSNLGPLALPHFKGYFVIQFRQAFKDSGAYPPQPGSSSPIGAYVKFQTTQGEIIEARIGTSFISIEQARRNLQREIPGWNFEAVRRALRAVWDKKLGEVSIDGATADQRHIFYTALYHAMLYPRTFTEYGRYYSAFDDAIHDGESYTDYSIWDIFRAEFSLLTLVAPERIDGMVEALLQDYQQGGWMPKWPNPSYTNIMIATHADSLVAEAINKHFHGFDYNLAWSAVYKDAMAPPDGDTTRKWRDREPHTPYEARGGLTYLKKLGYIPADKTAESASSTLEDSYDDWCVAQVAKALGKTEDYQFFLKRSQDYRNLFNRRTGFMQARNSDGSWADPRAGWTEGTKWVYTWDVLHDIPGLVQVMGGDKKYDAQLDAYFAGDHNWHSNEPSHHVGYLYDFGGQPWKTQARVREIADDEYANAPSGLDGDDDCGQMSAWYIFTALGFYPVDPASGEYMIGSPIFPEAVLRLADGKRFTIIADHDSGKDIYIQSATLNGKALTAPLIHYDQIIAGGTLHFVMGPVPSRWASAWSPSPIDPASAPSAAKQAN